MRMVTAMTLALALGACQSGLSAMPDGGVAAYDALRDAQKDCQAKGRTLRLKRGGNPQYIDDYACEKE